MPSKKPKSLWEAKPHTIAKIAILRAYLLAWFQVMARNRQNRTILYVDGFAGPGEYSNSETGSPIAALQAANGMIESSGSNWLAGDVVCAFIEVERKLCNLLQERVESFPTVPKLHTRLLNMTFVEGIAELQKDFPDNFTGRQPLFVFIDPFGATGAPFRTVKEILNSSRSEVLVNVDVDGVNRIFKAGGEANEALLNEIFPDDSWKRELSGNLTTRQRCRKVRDLYMSSLRGLPGVGYVYSFEMQKTAGLVDYHLVFATRHPLGLEKMKEAMKGVDQTGEYTFSDTRVGQAVMFRGDDEVEYSKALFRQFAGKRASYAALRDYALNETPFINPKAMLKLLEKQGSILDVKSTDPMRRKGTFAEEKIQYIQFKEGD